MGYKNAHDWRKELTMRAVGLATLFKLKSMGMVLFNLFGAGAYLLMASLLWFDPMFGVYTYSLCPNPLYTTYHWIFMVFPILALFAMINVIFIFWDYTFYLSTRQWSLGRAYLAVPIIWAVAFLIDCSQYYFSLPEMLLYFISGSHPSAALG